ncbi:Ubiquitin-like protein [Myotisia sp. PD_48]|nr:Ubiquitin-like protein [Myotisia sp. PD_48]
MAPTSPKGSPTSSKPASPRPSSQGVNLASRQSSRGGQGRDDVLARRGSEAPIPDDEQSSDIPMTMSASVMLTGLPKDAHQALTEVEAIDSGKGMFTPVES